MNAPTTADPLAQFQAWLDEAEKSEPNDPTATSLATATAEGVPSVRMVLLRGFDARGFVFYTNLESRKGRELLANPHAALCAYWPWIEEQARIEGRVVVADADESDEYFAARPRGSQIGAWASLQSQPLATRDELEARYRSVEARYAGIDVPRPPHWGGFRLIPQRIEFWRAGSYRLHERYLSERGDAGWQLRLLYP